MTFTLNDGNSYNNLSTPVTENVYFAGTPPTVVITSTGGLTNHTSETISGTVDLVDAGTTVTILDGSTQIGTAVVQSDGTWSDAVNLLSGDGTHTITATDTDGAGKTGTSKAITFTLDTTPPTVAITSAGANQQSETIFGTVDVVDAGTTVMILDGSTKIGTAVVQGDGSWIDTFNVPTSVGIHTITATDKDAAGNTGISNAVTLVVGGPDNDNFTLSSDFGQAWGNDGNDVLAITAGNHNALYGGTGDDTLTINAPTGTGNTADGGDGADTISVTGNSDIATGDAGDDNIDVIGDNNSVSGGDGVDTISVTGNSNYVTGDAGDDNIDVTGDNNSVSGGADDDTITLEQGNFNYLQGGDGNDTITVKGTGIGNSLDGGAGNDTLSAKDSAAAVGIYGDGGNDVLIGGQGNDFLVGGAGDDTISGGAGVDTVAFNSISSDFSITYDPINGLTVTDLRPGSPDGTDLISNDVEQLSFYDGTIGAGYFHTSAKADDGYIVGATVFADANGNGVLDAGEASTTTDGGGGFTLPAGASGPLILSGGTDVATGLAFGGEFLAPAGYDNINALTTVVELLTEHGGFANPELTVLANLGLGSTTNLASADPIVGFRSGANGLEIPDVQIANTVDLIASAIEGANSVPFASAYADAFHVAGTGDRYRAI